MWGGWLGFRVPPFNNPGKCGKQIMLWPLAPQTVSAPLYKMLPLPRSPALVFLGIVHTIRNIIFFAGRYEAEPCFPKLPELFGHGGGSTRPGQLSRNRC